MNLFNAQTGKRELIDNSEALQKALLEGTHTFKKDTWVPAFNSKNEYIEISSKDVVNAVQSGYRVATPTQVAINDYVKSNDNLAGSMKVALSQLADETFMGIPELIFESAGNPLEVAKREALKEAKSFSNAVGGVGGFGLSMLYGGPLFKFGAKAGEKVAATIAGRVLAKSGGTVSKRQALQVGRDLAGRIVGTGLEGAIVTAPYAITEAALGDPEAGGESLLAGVGVGALFGAGGVMAKGLTGLSKQAMTSVGAKVPSPQAMSRKLAKIFTGVPEDDLLYYVENAERVNKALPLEEIKNRIDDEVFKLRSSVEVAKENLGTVKDEFRQAYRAQKQALRDTRPPESLADDIMGALENQKAELGALSRQADDVLASTPGALPKKELLGFLDRVSGTIGIGKSKAVIGEKAYDAVRSLKGLKSRIDKGFGDQIDFVDLRDILRQVRDDIDFTYQAGSFNSALDKARKEFTGGISRIIKDKSDDYAELMAQMAPMADNLREMSRVFGTREKAIGALNSILGPKGGERQRLLGQFEALTGMNITSQLDDFKQARDLLKQAQVSEIPEQLIPEMTERLRRAEEAFEQAKMAYEPVKKLNPDATQAAIKNQGYKNASIEKRKAFEALTEKTGFDYLDEIKARNIFDQFFKDSTNGSRKTLLGAIIGSMVDPTLGVFTGGVAGAAADNFGGQVLKRLVDAEPNVSGLLFSEQAMKKTAQEIDRIPNILRSFAKPLKAAKPASVTGPAIFAVMRLGEGEKKTKADAISEFNTRLSEYVSNPVRMNDKLADMIAPIVAGGAPNIGQAFSMSLTRAMTYLHQEIPKPNYPNSPFMKQQWKPSDYEVSVFEQKLAVVMDPSIVLDQLQKSTLTKHHMDALKAVYPRYYDFIREKVQEEVVSGEVEMPYKARLKLSTLMDVPLDKTMTPEFLEKSIQASQQVIGEEIAESQAQVDLASNHMTPSQRLLS